MILPARALIATLSCLALSGCYVAMHGVESSAGGATSTSTSAQVAGAARFANGSAAFSSGPRIAPGAPGGQVSLGRGASGVLVVGLVLADLVNYVVGTSAPKPLPADARIMETCSCFQKPGIGNRE